MVEKQHDLCERLFEFAVDVIEFLKTLPFSPENKTIRTQLSKVLVLQEQIMKSRKAVLQKLTLPIK